MTDRYAVIGHPVAHSQSPRIHAEFACQTGQSIEYERLLAPLDGFAATVARFRAEGGRGANVTLPFKQEAFALADRVSERARRAEAVNTLRFDAEGVYGDNTDGAGLVADLECNLDFVLGGKRVLLVGAGGAARGVIPALLDAGIGELVVANRTVSRAEDLARAFAPRLEACAFRALAGRKFDLVINATSATLSGELPDLPAGLYAPEALAYDMMYGKAEMAFLAAARRDGASRVADGLGMLVEQAAESFLLWRGVRPDTTPVMRMLRGS